MEQINDPFRVKICFGAINSIPLVMLDGECDAFTAPIVHGAVSSLIEKGYKRIIIDMGHVVFLDVAGFHSLDDCCIKMQQAGGKILLVGASKDVEQVYEILRERESCKIVKNIDEALRKIV
ncbi:MAG: STAS domain-containing protein [Actinomycetota bacterium]|nr:STAS domain-containing protein [Actinomycetota bacterium]